MNHWQILEIEPVADTRLVRRAYAKVLKTIDQDLEPERFIALREALEYALAEIEYGFASEDEDEETAAGETRPQVEAELYDAEPAAEDQSAQVKADDSATADVDQAIAQDHQPSVLESTVEPVSLDQSVQEEDGESSDSYLRFEAVRQALYQHDFSEPVFRRFVDVLDDLPHQTLHVQLTAYDQLAYALALGSDLEDEAVIRDAEPFIRYWRAVRGNERPLMNAHPALHALYDRMASMADEEQFWQQVPKSYQAALQSLRFEPRIRYFHMLRLAWTKNPFIEEYLRNTWRNYPIQDYAQSFNVPLIGFLKNFWQNLPGIFMMLIALYKLLGVVMIPVETRALMGQYSTLFDVDTGFGLFLGLIALALTLLWTMSAQALICTWVVRVGTARGVAAEVAGYWFHAALVIALMLPLCSPTTQTIMLGLWLWVGAVVMGYARFDRPSIFHYLHQAAQNTSDLVFLGLVVMGLSLMTHAIIEDFGSKSGAGPSCVLLAFLPAVMIWNLNYFREVFKPSYSVLLLRFTAFMGLAVAFFVWQSDANLMMNAFMAILPEFSIMIFLFLFSLVVWVPEQKFAYGLKYGPYLLLLLLPLIDVNLWFLSAIFAFLLYRTARQDIKIWRNRPQALSAES